MTPNTDSQLTYKPIYILLILVALTWRMFGIFNNLWLDEIWSISIVGSLNSWIEIFTDLTIDNNHLLNSVFIFFLGDLNSTWIYRAPALIASVLSLYSLMLLFQNKKEKALLSLLLFSISFIMVLYGTEARGYSFLILFSLLSLTLLIRLSNKLSPIYLICFFLTCFFGLLSHSTFVFWYLGLFVLSLFSISGKSVKKDLLKFLSIHTAPALFCILFYFSFIKYLPAGTGYLVSPVETVINTLNIVFGVPLLTPSNPQFSLVLLVVSILIALIVVRALVSAFHTDNPLKVFYLWTIIITPLFIILVLDPRIIAPRYFLISIISLLLLFTDYFSDLFQCNPKYRRIVFAILVAYIIGNSFQLVNFLKYGRGQYQNALSFIADNSQIDPIRLSGTQGFRDRSIIKFYQHSLSKKFQYLDDPSNPPQWYLLQTPDMLVTPEQTVQPYGVDTVYYLQKDFPSAPLSGWRWLVYKQK